MVGLVLLLKIMQIHRSKEFREWMREKYPWIGLLYVPANCTGKLQICDTVINYPFKNKGKQQAVAFVCYKVKKALENARARGVSEEDIMEGRVGVEIDLRLSALKPRIPMWIKRSVDYLKTDDMRAAIRRWVVNKC